MVDSIPYEIIIAEGLRHLASIIEQHQTHNKIFNKIYIGRSGTGPEISIQYSGSKGGKVVEGEIALWAGHNDCGAIVIADCVSENLPGDKAVYHEVFNINDMQEAKPIFEKIITFFDLD